MKNIELKVQVKNFRPFLPILKSNAKYGGILKQIDIYYYCKNGKFKSREINNKEFVLIYYQRANASDSKLSDYQIMSYDRKTFNQIKRLLKSALGEKLIVRNKRQLWLIGATRIHLDQVSKLGNYLELETVLKGGNFTKARKEHQQIINKLHLDKYKHINESYSDLLPAVQISTR